MACSSPLRKASSPYVVKVSGDLAGASMIAGAEPIARDVLCITPDVKFHEESFLVCPLSHGARMQAALSSTRREKYCYVALDVLWCCPVKYASEHREKRS
jgi:hypothetical protein